VTTSVQPIQANCSKQDNDEKTCFTGDVANWTIMYYMAGDVEGMDSWTNPLIENLTKIKSAPDINLVIFIDGFERADLRVFYIDSNGGIIDLRQVFNWPDEVDSSDLNTLEIFCKQMIPEFPAKYYGLIPIASGGTGWQLMCLHDKHDGDIGVSIPDFANTLKNIFEATTHKIDVLFTSCAMNMIEVAYEFSPYVNYIVGTQTCYSKQYLVQRFYESVWDLKNDTSLTPEAFAKKAPERLLPLTYYYDESYYGKLPLLNRILLKLPFKAFHPVLYNDSTAVVNLSSIDTLVTSIDNISHFFLLNEYDTHIKEAVAKSWKQTKKLGECMANNKLLSTIHRKWQFEITSSTRYLDINHFMLLLKNNTTNVQLRSLCSDVIAALNDTISAIKKVDGDNQYGLSIYFPSTAYNYNKYPVLYKLPCPYEALMFAKNTDWDEFLKIYLGINDSI
jgi:hypothetical protein